MVSFSQLGKLGRLANQLFQVASTKGIAAANNTTASFPAWQYEQYFNEPLEHSGANAAVFKEQQYHYTPIEVDNVDLHGYFQSEKYFATDKPLSFRESFLAPLRAHPAFKKPTIGVHIRRGDYVGHPEYYQIPIHWYISALLSIPDWKEHNIVFISDNIGYAQVHFECLPNAYFIHGSDIEDLATLSLCDKHILSNSSYSWWGAYLSEQKHVIHCGELFRGNYFLNKDIKDFYPERWIKHKGAKLDLSDVTFTIPVMYDHADRKKNLDLSLCVLQQSIVSNYIIGEQGGKLFEYMGEYATYRQFPEIKQFHRTKMLNQMADMAQTEYIANWDADVFIPPMQLIQSMEALRSGVPVSYPYDGRFARLERQLMFKTIEQSLDIGLSAGQKFMGKNGRPMPETSVGGAVIWNKEQFIEAGMENENMISFGPEDVERHERMKMLNMEIHRAGGCLYHMNHYVGPDSSKHNPHFRANHAELDKMRKMNGHQMRQYIDTWKWRGQYTAAYYSRIAEGAIRSARHTYDALQEITGIDFRTKSVLDVGCGIGEWSLDNPHYRGIDFNIPRKQLLIPENRYYNVNLEKEGFDAIGVDLAICLEVAEHVSEKRADELVRMLCKADYVLFGAAIPNQGGTGHINEQWQTWWAEKFYANGFGAEVCYPVKDNPEVEPWYRQNMILYKRGSWGKAYDFVLPEYYLQIIQHFKNLAEEKRST
jgi:2-polyprenyl-3-methyl-5-hydroxy-6-metoxy-1,4-benzoquinol methylase